MPSVNNNRLIQA